MRVRPLGRILGAVAVTTWAALVGVAAPPASAQACPDVEIVFARGSGEAPGVGGVGQSFVDAVRAQAGPRTVNVYSVNYAASNNFDARDDLARTVVEGIRDAGSRVQTIATTCPDTDIVLGGFSQGAVVAGFVTSSTVPDAVPAAYRNAVPQPLAAEVAEHVSAVTLFGLPSPQWLGTFGAPPVVIGPLYEPKTLQLCAEGDTICNGAPGGQPSIAHALYGINGMTQQAATYAVERL
ncbi:cutinase [Mycobacterium sp. IS-1742]|uniref:cutinase family protein n=1 Tax=Mycobacterium sp. IS-1742 TaxID=1772285 RepID=UPI00073FD6FE|nr:cutinase family protein [Mycobacterium sp. IS-1742]KUI28335.1 cutinase [Mycobacterium sp. IS-1742]